MQGFTIFVLFSVASFVSAGISPVHDIRSKLAPKDPKVKFEALSPHNALKHLDKSIQKNTKNVTQNPKMEETLNQISKDLVSAILSKLEIQDKITRITQEALDAPGKNKGITAIETRRILDYISRTLSSNILTITKASTEPELHRLVFGLAQIASEIAIVSALKDITYSTALSKKQSQEFSLRKKRSVGVDPSNDQQKSVLSPNSIETTAMPSIYNVILNKTSLEVKNSSSPGHNGAFTKKTKYSVLSKRERKPIQVVQTMSHQDYSKAGFLNETLKYYLMNNISAMNETDAIIIDSKFNGSNARMPVISQEASSSGLDDMFDSKLNSDVYSEIEIDQSDIDEELKEKRTKLRLEKLEAKAKKAILYAGDVAYLTASSVVAMRRALTASIEVQMALKLAQNGMATHQQLMWNLARTAAQQAGKEAKNANSKSLACERVVKLAIKYSSQSQGANLNHVASRIVMDTVSLGTLAKSMAFVSSDIAINALYKATDVKLS